MKKSFKTFSLILSSLLFISSSSVCVSASAFQYDDEMLNRNYEPIENEDEFVKYWKDKEAAEQNKNVTFSFYADAEKTELLDNDDLPINLPVYYTITAKEGYFVTHIYGADGISYIDNSCFVLESKEKWPLVVSDRLAGDVNGDGKTASADIVKLMKFLAGDIYPPFYEGMDFVSADTNRDGKLNSNDLVRLMKLCAGINVSIPEKYTAGKDTGALTDTYYTLADPGAEELGPELCLINSVSELEEYVSAVKEKYDTETSFADRRSESGASEAIPEELDEQLLNTNKLVQMYNENFFSENTLVVYSYFNESPDPYVSSAAEYRGDCLTLCFEYIAQPVATGGGAVYVHEYFTLAKTALTEASVNVEITDISVTGWIY